MCVDGVEQKRAEREDLRREDESNQTLQAHRWCFWLQDKTIKHWRVRPVTKSTNTLKITQKLTVLASADKVFRDIYSNF